MMSRIFFTAIAAGLLAGLFISALQYFSTTPLIRAAEIFEHAAPVTPQPAADAHAHEHAPGQGHGHEHGHAHGEAGAPPLLFTVAANLIVGVGYALLLVACLSLHGRPVDGRRGAVWGMAGFTVFVLAPSFGLPPEAPGVMASDVAARQIWWLCAAGAAAAGLWLAVFARFPLALPAGVALALVPHFVGAPQPAEFGGSTPPELAARFATMAIAVGAAFWIVLGWLAGTFYGRCQTADVAISGGSDDHNKHEGATP